MILVIIPPAQGGGVYDFARRLQEAIGPDIVSLLHLTRQNASDWTIGEGDSVVLQMSGYGFEKRGAPLWLLRELSRRRGSMKRFCIYFHELYAFGPPWASSFWLSPVQRLIARRLAELSDFWITSREGYARWLLQHAGDRPHSVLSVFSTVGEAKELPQTRLARIVVFGSAGLREETYRSSGSRLFSWARKHSLEIHDVGAAIPAGKLSETLRNHGVREHGLLDEEAVGGLLETALFGLVAYPSGYLAKSSVFAAYCAHGVCPIVISDTYPEADGLAAGRHYLPGIPADGAAADMKLVGRSAWEWYQPHSLANHAAMLKRVLNAGD